MLTKGQFFSQIADLSASCNIVDPVREEIKDGLIDQRKERTESIALTAIRDGRLVTLIWQAVIFDHGDPNRLFTKRPEHVTESNPFEALAALELAWERYQKVADKK
ncbi:MAG: hypothetical protein JWO50_671 [Candidatus Kaiserbacteria bacterium]|nr:hypothetical protein [Candidatus Kaiserbacteria bacterium]